MSDRKKFQEALREGDLSWLTETIKKKGIYARLSAQHIRLLWPILDFNVLDWLDDLNALKEVLVLAKGLDTGGRTKWEEAFATEIEYSTFSEVSELDLIHRHLPGTFDHISDWDVQTTDREVITQLCNWGHGRIINPLHLVLHRYDFELVYEFVEEMRVGDYLMQMDSDEILPWHYNRYIVLLLASHIGIAYDEFKMMFDKSITNKTSLEWARYCRYIVNDEDEEAAVVLVRGRLNNPHLRE